MGLTLERNRDLQGRSGHVWYRRGLLCLVAMLPILTLLNVFGQRPSTTSAHGLAADLAVTAPARLRKGLRIGRWLPPARIVHPWPTTRFDAITQGRNPVR
jgi:hypothetical protein